MTNTPTDTSSLSPQDRMVRLEGTLGQICTLLDRETHAVESVDLKTFSDLQPEKGALLESYVGDLKMLLTRQGDLKQLPEEIKSRIRQIESRLADVRDRNLAALNKSGKSFSRLQNRILEIARSSVLQKRPAYGADGTLRGSGRKPISTGLSDQA